MCATGYQTIGVKTSLHITESPTIVGVPPNSLPAGYTLPIRHPDSSITKAIINTITPIAAEIQLPDGTRWRMTPHDPNADFPTMISSPGLHTQEWVIREKLA